MEVRDAEKPVSKVGTDATALARANSQGLTVRSAGLVRRGLRDLARDSNWLIKKIFAGRSASVAISDTGIVCAIPAVAQGSAQRLVLFDMEMNVPMMALSVPGESAERVDHSVAAFAWSPGARYLVAARRAWEQAALHIFDLHSKMLLGTFGKFTNFPARLEWAAKGGYFAAAAGSGKQASLRLWRAAADAIPFSAVAAHEMGLPEGFERQTYEAEFGEEGGFSGYGSLAFSPDGTTLASVAEIRGDWADDSIVFTEAATLQKKNVFHGQGHITDIAWTADSRAMIYCAAGQAYRLRTGNDGVGSLAVWRGILRVPSAFGVVFVFQFVAEEFGEGAIVCGGFEYAGDCGRACGGKCGESAVEWRGDEGLRGDGGRDGIHLRVGVDLGGGWCGFAVCECPRCLNFLRD